LLVLLLLFVFAIQDESPLEAGLVTGLIFFKPQFQAVPLIILLARRKWLPLTVAALTIVALAVLSYSMVGYSGIAQYLALLTDYLTKKSGNGSYPEYMQNLRALIQYTTPFEWVSYLWLLLTLPILAMTFFLNAKLCTNSTTRALQWLGNFAAMILIAPHLNGHDLAVLIIPTAFAVKLFGSPVPFGLVLILLGIAIYPLLSLAIGNHAPPLVPMILLIVFCWSVWSVTRSLPFALQKNLKA
jgi:hypothetical protein